MAGAVLEVRGVPPGAPEELLVLYFESRRRSGGGPVQSCQRLGPLLFLTFEDPQDAQNVLAHGSHRLGGAELGVRAAPPWDPHHLLLHCPDPRTPPQHLGTLLGVPPGTVTLRQGSVPGWHLLRLRDPLTPPELASAEQRARQRGLALLRAPRSPSVLVRAAGPALGRDLLELYFENRRSGGGRVRHVRPLPGGHGAIVTFQEPAVAERVLRRQHRLQDTVLELIPHYSFLELLQGSTDPPPDTVPALDGVPAPDSELVTDPLPDRDCPPDTAVSSNRDPAVAHLSPSPDTAVSSNRDPAVAHLSPSPDTAVSLVRDPTVTHVSPSPAVSLVRDPTVPDRDPAVAHVNPSPDTAPSSIRDPTVSHLSPSPAVSSVRDPGVSHLSPSPDTAPSSIRDPAVTHVSPSPDTAVSSIRDPAVTHVNPSPGTAVSSIRDPAVSHLSPSPAVSLDRDPTVTHVNPSPAVSLVRDPTVTHVNPSPGTAVSSVRDPAVSHLSPSPAVSSIRDPGVSHLSPSPDTAPSSVRDPTVSHVNPSPAVSSIRDPTVSHLSPSPDTAAAVPALPAAPTSHPAPGRPPAACPARDWDPEGFRAVPGQAQRPGLFPEPEPAPVPAGLQQDEALVPAEPGALRFLQRQYRDVLGSVPGVTLLPLDGDDVSGLRVSGEPARCRAVAEFLQSLLDSVASHPATLRFPGIARFLREPAGQSLLRQLENRFGCVIQLHGEPWSPPDPQLELEELLLSPGSHGQLCPHSWLRDLPEDSDAAYEDTGDGGDFSGFRSSAEELKEVLAALHPRGPAGRGSPGRWPEPVASGEWDLEAEFPRAAGGDGARALLSGVEEAEEEEVQMALAIQYSMDRTWCEEQELARATALSLRSYSREREQQRAQEDAGLLAALEASLEEALLAADAVRVSVFCSPERDASAVPRELERALAARLRAREVASERLRALPATGRCALALLRRRHAVQLALQGGTATLRGFGDFVEPAARELAWLLRQMPPPRHGATAATAHWVRWDPSGTAVPYGPEAAAQLERAWLRQERRLDLVLDGRPFTVDLERMEELDIGSARAVPVCRSQPPLDSTCCLLGPELAGLEEEVRLMPLAEDSEEVAEVAQHFCGTLEELRGRISIVQVQKLIHPVLYEQYQLKKGSVKRGCGAGTAVERVLFHGTTEASSREICLHGFNRSFCGRNATLYGLGVYFAARAAVSARDRYSPPGAGGTKFIFMAKVLTGEFAAGRAGLRAPPLREGSGAPRRFHSVVDDPRHPDIFVIFNDTQAYPQYLITCRSRHGGPL